MVDLAAAAGSDAEPVMIAGRYAVEATLGCGGMGAVYRVRDDRTARRLALKKLTLQAKHLEATPFLVSQFEREYHTLCQLAHPCIVEAYEYGMDGSDVYYTMELLEGTDLCDSGLYPGEEPAPFFATWHRRSHSCIPDASFTAICRRATSARLRRDEQS